MQDDQARSFHEIEAAREAWSVRELERQPRTTSRSPPRYQMYLPTEEELRRQITREHKKAEHALIAF